MMLSFIKLFLHRAVVRFVGNLKFEIGVRVIDAGEKMVIPVSDGHYSSATAVVSEPYYRPGAYHTRCAVSTIETALQNLGPYGSE